MSDLIRRSDVLNKVVRFPNYSENGESVDSYVVFDDDVMSIPAVDAVEVCRCADCVHFEPFRPHDGFCKIDGMLRDNDHFCKAGQRREDGDGDG